ncbi:MAG: hypothetical protein FJZ07_02815 [Candidatus Nealsonbacteria bacterium]|nr:hypothetical protein [Candidatus Nealsonbacteria bacterium]
MKVLKVGIIGPTNIKKLSKLTNRSIDFFVERAEEVGKILAELGCELWVNGDKGMAYNVALSYKRNNGKKVVVLYPKKGIPWPKEHVDPYIKNMDKIRKEPNWFWANYNVTAIPDICICVGLSAGTLCELAYIKWNCKLRRGNLKKLIAIKELMRDGKLPPEIEVDIKKVLIYINRAEDLENIFKKYRKSDGSFSLF